MRTAQTQGMQARTGGFTLVELLCALAVAALLAVLAYPSFAEVVHRTRRADALTALVQAQLAQGRFRSQNTRYGSLAEIGLGSSSPGGHYRLSVDDPSASGYALLAQAVGAQQADTDCSHLQLVVDGLDTRQASGPDARTGNPPDTNQRCWGR